MIPTTITILRPANLPPLPEVIVINKIPQTNFLQVSFKEDGFTKMPIAHPCSKCGRYFITAESPYGCPACHSKAYEVSHGS